MPEAPRPADEAARLATLRAYHVLDTLPEPPFDDIARLAAGICGTPIALVSLVDDERQWFKAELGLGERETDRCVSFCAYAIHRPEVMEVEDATTDPRFTENALVRGAPFIRFYAGAPLWTDRGHALGTLCVIDSRPRKLLPSQRGALAALARQVMAQLELRRAYERLDEAAEKERKMAERVTALTRQRAVDRATTSVIDAFAHHPTTPLNPARSLVHLLDDGRWGPLTPDQSRAVRKVEQNLDRFADAVDGVVDLARLQGGRLSLRASTLDLGVTVREALGRVAERAVRAEVGLELRLPRAEVGPVTVMGEDERLRRAVVLLLENALAATSPGGHIGVLVEADGASARVVVTLAGPGSASAGRDAGQDAPARGTPDEDWWPEEEQEALPTMEGLPPEGQRSPIGPTLGSLGLTICRALVEVHGGHVEAERAGPASGARFTITLPRAGSGSTWARTPTGVEA